jgi:hypothetical protein
MRSPARGASRSTTGAPRSATKRALRSGSQVCWCAIFAVVRRAGIAYQPFCLRRYSGMSQMIESANDKSEMEANVKRDIYRFSICHRICSNSEHQSTTG